MKQHNTLISLQFEKSPLSPSNSFIWRFINEVSWVFSQLSIFASRGSRLRVWPRQLHSDQISYEQKFIKSNLVVYGLTCGVTQTIQLLVKSKHSKVSLSENHLTPPSKCQNTDWLETKNVERQSHNFFIYRLGTDTDSLIRNLASIKIPAWRIVTLRVNFRLKMGLFLFQNRVSVSPRISNGILFVSF